MSNAVSALQGVVNADGIADLRELGLRGMITLRGDLSDRKLIKAVKSVAGNMPAQGRMVGDLEQGACWMSPDELLILCPHAQTGAVAEKLSKALAKHHALIAPVSDARAVFEISGPHAREVLAKLAPVDLHPRAFEPGMFRRSRLAQVPAAFWMSDEETFTLVCFRSVARYVMDLLSVAAQEGSEVGAF